MTPNAESFPRFRLLPLLPFCQCPDILMTDKRFRKNTPFLKFRCYEPVYFKLNDEKDRQAPERKGHWVGVSESVGDTLAYKIWDPENNNMLKRSLVRTTDQNKGAIPNRCLDPPESTQTDSGEEDESQSVPRRSQRFTGGTRKSKRLRRINKAS